MPPNYNPADMNRECTVCGKYLVFTRQHEVKVHRLMAHSKSPKRTKQSKELVPVVETNHKTKPDPLAFFPAEGYVILFGPDGSKWLARRFDD